MNMHAFTMLLLIAYIATAFASGAHVHAHDAVKRDIAGRDGFACTTDVAKLGSSALKAFPTPPPELTTLIAAPAGLVTVVDLCTVNLAPALATPYSAYKGAVFSWGNSFLPAANSILKTCTDMAADATVAKIMAAIATAAASAVCDHNSGGGGNGGGSGGGAGTNNNDNPGTRGGQGGGGGNNANPNGAQGGTSSPKVVMAAGMALAIFVGAVIAL